MPYVKFADTFDRLPLGEYKELNAKTVLMWEDLADVSHALGDWSSPDSDFVKVFVTDLAPHTFALYVNGRGVHVDCLDLGKCFDGLRLAYDLCLMHAIDEGYVSCLPPVARRDALMQWGQCDKMVPQLVYVGDEEEPTESLFVTVRLRG